MKKIFTLFISSLFSLFLMARDGSRLSISTVSNSEDYKVEVDGRKFMIQDHSVILSNLSEGFHQVKIFREGKKKNGRGFRFGRNVIIYSNSVFLKRGFHTDITINRFGKALLDERRIDRNDDWYDDEDDYNDGNNNDGGWNNGYGNVMSQREFDQVKEQIRKEWFEANRLVSVRTIIDKNNFTTQQVREFMQLFSFENNKLEVAKYAYRKTVDKQNYYQLNELLFFSSSKDELARFIRESR
ncbi:MAG: DUF4476 domain-containing protein [Chitinophagaceae bacterium]